ncbi:MAG: lipoprotein-releasing ABC transporter permease subunit [Gammaproteobacteria bacterium]
MALFRPLSFCIGLRYTRSSRGKGFVSFIALSSMLGIALGVAVLITVLSVMNGFDEAIQHRIAGMAHHITIRDETGHLKQWPTIAKTLAQDPEIEASAPFVIGQGMLSSHGVIHGTVVFGIDPHEELKVAAIGKNMIRGALTDLQSGQYGMVLGLELAQSLGLDVGDKVTLITPQMSITPLQVMPRMRRFTVRGLFSAGNGFGFDSNYAFIDLKDAQTLYGLPHSVTGLRLRLQHFFSAPLLARELRKRLPPTLVVSDWTDNFGALFEAIRLEKTMMFIILLMIITVAAFNLVATLVVAANDKRSDMAILRTLGATPRQVMGVFMVQGLAIGVVGILLGLLFGLLLAWNVTDLVDAIQHYFNVQLLSSNIYYVNYLPSKILWSDVIQVTIAAFCLSVLATIYPAWRASRVPPAEALRYE